MNTNNEIVTMTPDEFAAKFAPAATPDSYFIRNRETGKLELHFDKADYDDLTDDQKREIKSAFLWGRRSGCWISRCKEPNLWRAEKIAKALGLADGGTTGERLSFAEQQERKAEKAERRAERFECAADAAEARGEALQKPINDMRGDIAFFTQPNINSSAGRAFTRQRERMFAAYESGFKEFNKSAYDDRVIIFYNIKGGKQVSYIDVAAALDAAPEAKVSDFITNAPPTKKPLSHNGSRVFLYALCQKLGCAGFAAWKTRARKLEKLRKPKATRFRALMALLQPSVKAFE